MGWVRGMGREHGEMRGNGKSEDQGRVDGRKGERGDIKIDTYVNRQTQTDRQIKREKKSSLCHRTDKHRTTLK